MLCYALLVCLGAGVLYVACGMCGLRRQVYQESLAKIIVGTVLRSRIVIAAELIASCLRALLSYGISVLSSRPRPSFTDVCHFRPSSPSTVDRVEVPSRCSDHRFPVQQARSELLHHSHSKSKLDVIVQKNFNTV